VRAVAVLATLAGAVAAVAAVAPAGSSEPASSADVLLVGSWHGNKGKYTSIAAAVRAATPGDWILVGPGDYRERPGSRDGVRITTPNLHIRGMSRTNVVVDGTRPGAPRPCAPQVRWQNLGAGENGRNGIVADAGNDSVENLTVCNFVGGRDSQQLVVHWAFRGSFLTATSTFASRTAPALYGISVSHAPGPVRILHSYASNMADSAFHIGGCADCNAVFDHVTAEHSVIGFTAIDAGGRLAVQRSVFRDNTSGIDLASEEDDSSPPPQDGRCPHSPPSCTFVRDNLVEGNNDPNVPGGQGGVLRFIGAGILVAGGRNDTIVHNAVHGQGAYGIVVTPYPWLGRPDAPGAHCQGGQHGTVSGTPLCFFDAYGNIVSGNTLSGNGLFGNPTNGSFADASAHGDVGFFGPVGAQIACATEAFGSCDGTDRPVVGELEALGRALGVRARIPVSRARYPNLTRVTAQAPPAQPSMPDPCAGVPANPWCPGSTSRAS
jgi:hypothetical protein